MQLRSIDAYKSIGSDDFPDLALPNLVVLTGLNGSGKTHLLESIASGSTVVWDGESISVHDVKSFGFGQLLANSEEPASASVHSEPWARVYDQFEGYRTELLGSDPADFARPSEENVNSALSEMLINNSYITRTSLDHILANSGKSAVQLTLEDFRRFAPLMQQVWDPFSSSTGRIFVAYQAAKSRNDYLQWSDLKYGTKFSMPDDDFLQEFGPPPWDLLNQTLKILGLDYVYDKPSQHHAEQPFSVGLVAPSGKKLSPSLLSAGERTILAVAISSFLGPRSSDLASLPKLLLLDEPDATLHPSMVRKFLALLQDVLVEQNGVRVVLTTHSPTTVALAPEESVF